MNYSKRRLFRIVSALIVVVLNVPLASAGTISIGSSSTPPLSTYVVSDSSSGVFHPTSDFTLDLSDVTVPQYSSVFIDAGITLTVLTPTGGVFADLLAAQDIIVYGAINAGSGALSLIAGNQIILGIGSEIIAGSISLASHQPTLDGGLAPIDPILHGIDLGRIPGGRVALVPEPGIFLLPEPGTLMLILPVLIFLALRRPWQRERGEVAPGMRAFERVA